MKILYINNFFNPGGSSIACYELALALKEQFEIRFIGCVPGIMKEKYEKIGRCYLLEKGPSFNLSHLMLTNIINEYNPDIIHVFIPGHENPTYFNILPTNKKLFCTVLCGQKIGFSQDIFEKIIFPSKYNLMLSGDVENKKFKIVRYGISDCQYNNTVNKPFTFGRISAFCPSKNIDHTISCAKELKENRFIIAGEIQDISYYSYCKHLAKDSPNIELCTNISNENKKSIMNMINILHYPTSNEAFCYSILEAMQQEKPIITYDNSALKEFDSRGIIYINERDAPSLVEKTKELADSSLEDIYRMGRVNRQVYNNHYTGDIYGKNIRKLYDC